MKQLARPAAGFARGVTYPWRGFRLLLQPGIRRYVIAPLLINIAVFALGVTSLAHVLDYAMDQFLPDWMDWLRYLLWPLFIIAALGLVFFAFSAVANLVASPFNGILAAAVERHLRGVTNAAPFTWRALLDEAWRSLRGELRKLAYFGGFAIPCLILLLIPGVNVLAAPLWLLFGAWMLAVEYIDCPLGNHGQPFPAVRNSLRGRRALAFGFGLTMTPLTVIPVLNFVAMPVGVAAATMLYLECLQGEAES